MWAGRFVGRALAAISLEKQQQRAQRLKRGEVFSKVGDRQAYPVFIKLIVTALNRQRSLQNAEYAAGPREPERHCGGSPRKRGVQCLFSAQVLLSLRAPLSLLK